MAVFGAPETLAAKERAPSKPRARSSTRRPRICRSGSGSPPAPGFAGNIRAADRLIWSVIGDTTNLAARLQSLTRELEASIAIDETTRVAAGYVCADFTRHDDVSLRGRSQRVNVFALPLARAAGA